MPKIDDDDDEIRIAARPVNTNRPYRPIPPAADGTTQGRGFARLSPSQRAEVAALGGRVAHALKRAHTWTPETAKDAGRRGGRARAARPKSSE